VEAVEEVFTELPRGQGVGGGLVGGRDDPDVDVKLFAAADATERVVLKDPQELGLHRNLQLGDLVEEEGAPVGELEAAEPPLDRSREGAALVSENLALDKRLGNGGAVDGDERALAAAGALVDRPRDPLLAGAALAVAQDRRAARGGRLDPPLRHLHRRRLAHALSERPRTPAAR